MADKKQMKGRRRRIYSPHEPKPKQTNFDIIGMSLRCVECERIWNGPHRGEKVKRFSTQSRAIEEESKRKGYSDPGISDGVCHRRSCQEANNHRVVTELRGRHNDYEATFFDDLESRMNRESYELVRSDPDRYPEGLLDDVEPPL